MNAPLRFPAWRPGQAGKPQIGILTNPRSGGNRKRGGAVRQVLVRHPEIIQLEADNPADMGAALDEFARREVGLLILNGGDGTVQAVFTALGRHGSPDALPTVALLEAGTTSMLARDVGLSGAADLALQRLFTALSAGLGAAACHLRPILQVESPSHPEALYGMFFGAGAICQGIDLFHGSLNPSGRRGEALMGVTLARMLLDVALGRNQAVPATPVEIAFADESQEGGERLLVLASTLERLFLGMRPYWGEEAAPIHVTALAARPKKLLRSLPWLLRGRRLAHAVPEHGYLSRNAEEVRLDFSGPFTLDGELFRHDGLLVLRAAGPIPFLRL